MAEDLMSYALLAKHYDQLMSEVPYDRWIRFIDRCARLTPRTPLRILDAGCGTGTVAIGLSMLGYDVMGIDQSPEMLSIAQHKSAKHSLPIQWLEGSFLDLQTEAGLIVCTCDGVNHIKSSHELISFFSRTHRLLNPLGYLIFDINSEHKYENILANNTFSWRVPGLEVVWLNNFHEPMNWAKISLYSHLEKDLYSRTTLNIIQRCYRLSSLLYYLRQCGYKINGLWNNYGCRLNINTASRITVVAQKLRRS
jgi:SAM-dependent methyltransferase